MLQPCEFNGKKDVLHFQMLQAAINENNARKIENQREKNLSEKICFPQKGLEQSDEKPNEEFDDSSDERSSYFKNTKSHSVENECESKSKKRKMMSSCVASYGSEACSKKGSKKHRSSKIKSRHHGQSLPLSKNQKLHKSLRENKEPKEHKMR